MILFLCVGKFSKSKKISRLNKKQQQKVLKWGWWCGGRGKWSGSHSAGPKQRQNQNPGTKNTKPTKDGTENGTRQIQ